MNHHGAAQQVHLSIGLRLWGRLTAWSVTRQAQRSNCRHDGEAPICNSCAFALGNGIWLEPSDAVAAADVKPSPAPGQRAGAPPGSGL